MEDDLFGGGVGAGESPLAGKSTLPVDYEQGEMTDADKADAVLNTLTK